MEKKNLRTENTQHLWQVFLNNYEQDFKEYMGYGKEEIERIGIETFFNNMGWENENQLGSYRTDLIHIMPCIDCGEKFGIFERDFGLCEDCQKKYDLEMFEKYKATIAATEGQKYNTTIVQLFLLSKEFRSTFANGSDDAPLYAIWATLADGVEESELEWNVCDLSELKNRFSGPQLSKRVFKIILKNLQTYTQDGQDKFFAYENVNWDKLYNGNK